MSAFVTKDNLDALYKHISSFMTRQDCEEYEKRIVPILDDCENALTLYNKEHNQMKEVIARFDVVISDKVNKKDWNC